MTPWILGYAAIGITVGVLAARAEYRDGDPGRLGVVSAGTVGTFVACFWPFIVIVGLFGLAARWGKP